MSKHVNVIVLRTAGTNCNEEAGFAFTHLGARASQVHINDLAAGKTRLSDFHILVVPGGFSYGDDVASGRILANELRLKLGNDLRKFIADGKLVIGICNGFQVLVKAGILPGLQNTDGNSSHQDATLFYNDSAKFEDRWVHLAVNGGKCVWTKDMPAQIYLPVAHGEGKFIPKNEDVLTELKNNGQVVFTYCTAEGKKPSYPQNPNGSTEDIAGICDPTGRVLGLMPHPERHFLFEQHPFWTRLFRNSDFGDGAPIFRNGMEYAKKHL